MSIPVVDFGSCGVGHQSLDDEAKIRDVGEQLYEAFKTTGFVYLMNTGLNRQQVDEVNTVTEMFFQLPDETKLRYSRKVNNFGYDALGKERLADGLPGDYKESFNITGRAVKDPDIVWPDDVVSDFSAISISFMKQCKVLVLRIMDALSYGMDLDDKKNLSSLHASILERNNHSSLRCLYYPPVTDHCKDGQVRLAEHTDYGCITLLFQDSIGGLQIKTREGDYIDAVPIEDSVLVNVADLLQFWTNGKLRSTPHRILNPSDESQRKSVRRSIAFFVHPNEDLPVLKNLLNVGDKTSLTEMRLRHLNASQLENMTVGDYVLSHFTNNYSQRQNI